MTTQQPQTAEVAAAEPPVVARKAGRRGDLTLGAAGLILVLGRLAQFASFAAKDIGDVFWFISSTGILASLLGLVLCVISLFTGSGRRAGFCGILVWGALAAFFMAASR